MLKARQRRSFRAAALSVLFVLALPAASAVAASINGSGPLTRIDISEQLNCAVNHVDDQAGEFYGATACGTLIAARGVLYGPEVIPAGNSAGPRTPWQPVTQTTAGQGTDVDPHRITTVVDGAGLRVTQIDTYVVGTESYGTRVSVTNTSSEAVDLIVYRAGDCFLQNSDIGFGRLDTASGSVACAASAGNEGRVQQWAPLTAGASAMESNYNSVWSRIGQQLPFENTCECDNSLDNGAGLSWESNVPAGQTRSFAHLTSFSPNGSTQVQDSDGDSFPDEWETENGGVDTNSDGTPDLNLYELGARPNRPDIFVQTNWTRSRSCILFFCRNERTYRPNLAALRDVQASFRNRGISLHIDAGPQSQMDPFDGRTWDARSKVGGAMDADRRIPGAHDNESFDWTEKFDEIRSDALPEERRRLFHFALYVGSYDPGQSSGISRGNTDDGLAGRDFIVAHGDFGENGPSRIQESGTFMHEFGHNLGLSHGGSLEEKYVNYKPNYPSIMSYSWQMSGTFKNSSLGLLDYSDGTLDPVNEADLSEPAGLAPDPVASDIGTRFVCPANADSGETTDVTPAVANIDWNCNGRIDPDAFSANINAVGFETPAISVLTDHADWDQLTYDGGGAIGGAGFPSAVENTTPLDEEAPAANVIAAGGDLKTVQLTALGQLNIQTGTQAPVELRIANRRGVQRTYALDVQTGGVTLSGLPASITLEAGQTRTLTGVLTAGATNQDAFVQVNAGSDDPTDRAAAITEITVTDRVVADQPPLSADPDPSPGSGSPAPDPTAAAPGTGTGTGAGANRGSMSVPPAPKGGVVIVNDTGASLSYTVDKKKVARLRKASVSTAPFIAPGQHAIRLSATKATPKRFTEKVRPGELVAAVVSRRGKRLTVKTTVIKAGARRVVSLSTRTIKVGAKTITLTRGIAKTVSATAALSVGKKKVRLAAGTQLVVLIRTPGGAVKAVAVKAG